MSRTTRNTTACRDCRTRGNVCRDSDGVPRCRACSYTAWLARQTPIVLDDAAGLDPRAELKARTQ